MLRLELKDKVRTLRRKGLTYLEINSELKTDLSKSTISDWCRNIELSDIQQSRIRKLNLSNLADSRLLAIKAKKLTRTNYLHFLKNKYSQLSKHFEVNNNSTIVALAILYLTEGTKQPGKLTFGNSDPRIIKLFLKLLRSCFVIDESKFRCTVQCRADQNQPILEKFWSDTTGIRKDLFYKTRIDARSFGKVTLKKDYSGVCRIDYFSGSIYNELQVIADVITK